MQVSFGIYIPLLIPQTRFTERTAFDGVLMAVVTDRYLSALLRKTNWMLSLTTWEDRFEWFKKDA